MAIIRNKANINKFNPNATLPFELRPQDFQMAMQDVYDPFAVAKPRLLRRGYKRGSGLILI